MSKAIDDLQMRLKKINYLENESEVEMRPKATASATGKKIAILIEDNRKANAELAELRAERKRDLARWKAHSKLMENRVFQLLGEKLQFENEIKIVDSHLAIREEKDQKINQLQSEVKRLQGQVQIGLIEANKLKIELDNAKKREKEHLRTMESLTKRLLGHGQVIAKKQEEIAEKERAYKGLSQHLSDIQNLSFQLKSSHQEKERNLYQSRNELKDKSAELERLQTVNNELAQHLQKHKERIGQLLEINREQSQMAERLFKEICKENKDSSGERSVSVGNKLDSSNLKRGDSEQSIF